MAVRRRALGGIERLLDALRAASPAAPAAAATRIRRPRLGQAAHGGGDRAALGRAPPPASPRPGAARRHGRDLCQPRAAGGRAGGAGRAGAGAALDRARRPSCAPPARAVEPRPRHLSAPAGPDRALAVAAADILAAEAAPGDLWRCDERSRASRPATGCGQRSATCPPGGRFAALLGPRGRRAGGRAASGR